MDPTDANAGSDVSVRNSPDIGRAVTCLLLALWCVYSLNGFRGWWVPIELSDANAGSAMRQLLFAGGGAVSLLVLWISGRVWETVRAQMPVLLLGMLMLLSAAYSELPSLTIKRTILYLCGMLMAWAYVLRANGSLRTVHRDLLIVTCSIAWMSLAWRIAFPLEITTNPGRPGLAGVSNHPNTLAPAMALGCLLALSHPTHTALGTLGRLIGGAGSLVALALAASATSFALVFVGGVAYTLLRLRTYWSTLMTLVIAAGAAGVGVVGPGLVADSLLASAGRDRTMSGRDELWSAMIGRFLESPVLGHGWGAFWTEGRGREIVSTWNPRQSHNAYIDIGVDLGVVGLVAVFAIALPALIVLLKGWTGRDRSCALGFGAAIIALMGVYGMQQSYMGKVDTFAFTFLLIVCVLAWTRIASVAGGKDPDPLSKDRDQRITDAGCTPAERESISAHGDRP